MIELFQATILSIIQGITEFIPVSSSGHLVIFPKVFGWQDQGLCFDIAVHLGTLVSVLTYFRRELKKMTSHWVGTFFGYKATEYSRLTWAVLLGTIPVGLTGLLAKSLIEQHLRSPVVIGLSTVAFGVLLGFASFIGKSLRNEHSITYKDMIVIGCAQALALIPGTSRSGITMTAGLMMGFTREAAARYSFLLSIPVIVLAAGLQFIQLMKSNEAIDWGVLTLGFSVSAVFGFCCIHIFLNLLKRVGLYPFVIYRIAFGFGLLYLFLS